MVTVKILGTTPPCAKCKRAEREAIAAAQRFGGQVEVVKVDALSDEAEAYGMVVTPGVVVDEELVSSGKIMRADELAALIEQKLGG
jgi:hypothetical protein